MIDGIDKHIDIGEFFIAPSVTEGKVWIGRQDGEGGDFSIVMLQEVIRKFYDEHF